MTPYIVQVGLIIAGCLAFYKVLLQKETFYQVNRYVLISCLLVAFVLPLVPVPQKWSFRAAEPTTTVQLPQASNAQEQPSTKSSEGGDIIKLPPVIPDATPATAAKFSLAQVLTWLTYLYWFGVVAFGLNFLVQVVVLFYRAYRSPVIVDGRYRIVEIHGDKAPCSFANNIFINPEKYEWETYNQILLHEKVHIRQRHSMDLLLAELVLIFQWFNPFAWLYRKEMENNLEFLTDDQMVERERVEKASYQISLLKVSSPQLPLSITTNYNQSLLKKRIAMMNTKKSNLHTAWKYFFLLPVLVLFASLMNDPVAQVKPGTAKRLEGKPDAKPDPQANLSTDNKSQVKPDNNLNVKQEVQTNNQNEKNVNQQTNVSENANVKTNVNTKVDATVKANTNTNINVRGIDTEGSWFATIKGDKVSVQFKSDDDDDFSSSTTTFNLSDFSSIPKGTAGTFKVVREAGTMEFTGKFEDNQGMGSYKFIADKQYKTDMDREIESDLTEKDVLVFFFIDIKRSYVAMLKQEGYKDIGKNDVIPMAALKIDGPYIRSMKAAGLKDLSMRDLIPLKSLKIDGEYVTEIRNAGYKDVDAQQLITFKSQGIDGKYVEKMLKGDGDIKPGDLVALKSLKIDDEYINSFRSVGMTNLSSRDIIPMKSLGITAEYAKGFQALGYKNITPRDLIPLKSQKITPEFIKGFQALGFEDIPLNEVVSLKAVGVTPEYVKEMKGKGFNYSKLNKYISLKSIGDH